MIDTRVVRWFHGKFRNQVIAATHGTPFRPDFLVAISMKETGYLISRMLKAGLGTSEILLRCVGDTIDRHKDKFTDDAASLATVDDADHTLFRICRDALESVAPFSRGYARVFRKRPTAFCRGFGIFQYDLQFFENDRDFFLERQWDSFDACLEHFIRELEEAQARNDWLGKAVLTRDEEVGLGIAYNRGRYDPDDGFQQGHQNETTGLFYGEELDEILGELDALGLDWAAHDAVIENPPPSSAHLVIASALTVRSAPQRDAAALGSLPRLSRVEELEANDDSRSWLDVRSDGLTGWMSNAYLVREDLFQHPWIAKACGELGVGEFADDDNPDNPRIQEYFETLTGRPAAEHRDSTAWCSAFANWCVEPFAATDGITKAARSWQDWGEPVSEPRLGAIIVSWRRPGRGESERQHGWTKERLKREGSYGHVGFLLEVLDGRAVVLSGNQSSRANTLGEVNKKEYQLDGENTGLVGYRWPRLR